MHTRTLGCVLNDSGVAVERARCEAAGTCNHMSRLPVVLQSTYQPKMSVVVEEAPLGQLSWLLGWHCAPPWCATGSVAVSSAHFMAMNFPSS